MRIREATDGDRPSTFPFSAAIVAAGETCAHPEDLSCEQARALWLEPPPGRLVGLHVMHHGLDPRG